MRVCVIGAGPSGLTTIKQLKDEQHDVVCFERNDDIGGIWNRSSDDKRQMKAYDGLMLTISMRLMSFSDFMYKEGRKFTDHQGYLQYLRAYTDKFNLRPHIRFSNTIEEVRREPDGSWLVVATDRTGAIQQHKFDAVAVCSGPFKSPNVKVPEIEGFSGTVLHSSGYRNNEEFVGKRVLAIGLAESGADILREISDVASQCTVSVRSHTFLIPRLIYGKYSTDTLTTRSHHYEMWHRASDIQFQMKSYTGSNWLLKRLFLIIAAVYGIFSFPLTYIKGLFRAQNIAELVRPVNNMGQLKYPSKVDMDTPNEKEVIEFVNNWNRKSHKHQGNWSQKIIFSKNVSFVPNILAKKLQVQETGIARVDGKSVYFNDGTVQEFDHIVLCTGFLKDFSFIKGAQIADNNVRNLYKHAFHPECDGRLALIGFVRPISGGIPICSEMQARYFAQLCSGNIQLPKDVKQRIEKEKDWEEKWMCLSPRHTESMPSQIMFLDSMAKEIGCHYPLYKLILKPRLLVALWFYTFNQSCYRLTGPHSQYQEALADIMTEEVPLHDNMFMLIMIVLSLLPSAIHPKNLDFKFSNSD